MDQSAINVRYAKAFFSSAKEKKQLIPLKNDIETVYKLCQSSKEFIQLLESPVVRPSKKSAVIQQIFDGAVHPFTLKFLLLIIENKREMFLPGICRNFLDLTRKDQHIKSAVLTSATKLSTKTIQNIKDSLAKEMEASIELSTQIKPEIIGGLVLRLDDKQYDASIATQLKKIKQNLLKSEL